MHHIFSTLSNDNEYVRYSEHGPRGINTAEATVLIKGGSGINRKNIPTPLGVHTVVADEDMEWLKENYSFKQHMKNGYITVRKQKVDAEVAAADMTVREWKGPKGDQKGDAFPIVPQDFSDKKIAEDLTAIKPTVNKKSIAAYGAAMNIITYNDTAFRALFPAYVSISQFPPVMLQAYWDTATAYISNAKGGCYAGGMTVAQRTLALNLMTAHLVFLSCLIASGETGGIVTGATIDKVSVTLEPPPSANQWQYWLNQSPYGRQLLALLQVASVGGGYVTTGVPGRAGFRFGNGW